MSTQYRAEDLQHAAGRRRRIAGTAMRSSTARAEGASAAAGRRGVRRGGTGEVREYKRRAAGAADYMAMEGEFRPVPRDVYSTDPVPRDALTTNARSCGRAGFAGLLLWYKLRQEGFSDVRFCESRRRRRHLVLDRYPGIACDVESTAISRCSRRWATSPHEVRLWLRVFEYATHGGEFRLL